MCPQVNFLKLLLPPALKMKNFFIQDLRMEIKYLGIYALFNLLIPINLQCQSHFLGKTFQILDEIMIRAEMHDSKTADCKTV